VRCVVVELDDDGFMELAKRKGMYEDGRWKIGCDLTKSKIVYWHDI
jgi:hypothetical protein